MKDKRFRRFRRRLSVRRRPINVFASALTAAGLYCGIASIFKAIDQDYNIAAYFILAALVFDVLDGTVAKLTKSVSEFGKELDSLCDLVSFGAAPAVLIYTAFLTEEHAGGPLSKHTGALIAIVYVIFGALRLARYNVFQSDRRDYFIGLPIPAAASTIATFVLFTHYLEVNVAAWVLFPMTVGLAGLMVGNLRYPKDKMKVFVVAPRNAIRTLAIVAVILGVFHKALIEHSPAIVLFPCAAAYSLYGIGDFVYQHAQRRPSVAESLEAHAEPPEGADASPPPDPPGPPV
jgi:CDP-diacylglycerol--serine O-phosphatidyltransferase